MSNVHANDVASYVKNPATGSAPHVLLVPSMLEKAFTLEELKALYTSLHPMKGSPPTSGNASYVAREIVEIVRILNVVGSDATKAIFAQKGSGGGRVAESVWKLRSVDFAEEDARLFIALLQTRYGNTSPESKRSFFRDAIEALSDGKNALVPFPHDPLTQGSEGIVSVDSTGTPRF